MTLFFRQLQFCSLSERLKKTQKNDRWWESTTGSASFRASYFERYFFRLDNKSSRNVDQWDSKWQSKKIAKNPKIRLQKKMDERLIFFPFQEPPQLPWHHPLTSHSPTNHNTRCNNTCCVVSGCVVSEEPAPPLPPWHHACPTPEIIIISVRNARGVSSRTSASWWQMYGLYIPSRC